MTSAELIQNDQRPVGCSAQDVARLADFDEESALAFEEAVAGTHADLMEG